jgi:diguanylate cyclase (GGDEF)-like protein
MTFDDRSLLAVAAALGIVLGMIVLALERRLSQPAPGLRLWAVANFSLGAAASLLLLQGIAPPWVPVLAGGTLVVLARALNVAALRQFDHRRAPASLLASFCVVLTVALAILFQAWPSHVGRSLVMAGGVAALAIAAVVALAMAAPSGVGRWMAMLGFAGLALAHLSWGWLHADGVLQVPSQAPLGAVPLALLVALDVLCNVGFLLMITDRVNDWVLQLARTDPLTGLLSRGALVAHAQRDLLRARRHGGSTAALVVDVDGFRAINGRYGRAAGDAVLQHVALHGQSVLRCTDLFGRSSGDEFIAVLPETDLPVAAGIAERLRVAVAEPTPGVASDLPATTVSIGVAVVAAGAQGSDDLVSLADTALRGAGKAGRNRTYVARDATAPAKTALRLIRGGRAGHAP